MKSLLLTCIRLYKKCMSPLFGHSICRFTPTCSEYTYQAINRYGIITGSWIGLKRIITCHPWNKGGYDPL